MSRSYVQPSLFVAGEWILDAAGREALAVTNPANGQILAQLPLATASDLDAAIEAAGAAFAGWRGTPALQRSEIVRRAGALIRQRRDLIGQVIAQELGKPLQEAQREADTIDMDPVDKPEEQPEDEAGEVIDDTTFFEQLEEALAVAGDLETLEEVWTEFDPLARFEGNADAQKLASMVKKRHLKRIGGDNG